MRIRVRSTFRRPPPCPPGGREGRDDQGGFTLIEVMLALAILALAVVVVLDQRVDVVREAAAARDARTVWMLASRKIAELEMDKTLWTGQGGSGNGDFSEIDGEYAGFTWEYLAVREPVEVVDPALVKPGYRPPEMFRVALAVRAPGAETPTVLEAMFPLTEQETAPPPGGTPAPPDGNPPSFPPPDGGKNP